MTLTFDLVTLTLGQLQRLININNICKYHQNPSIRWCFINFTRFFFYIIAYLTFDLVTLTFVHLKLFIIINHVCKYHQYPFICSWFIVHYHSMLTHQPTQQPTYLPTYLRTLVVIELLSSSWTRLKTHKN